MTDEIEVTQADREAAASGYFAWCSGNPVIPDRMKAGQADDHSMVQAFARHRAAALQSLAAQLAEARAENERLRGALGLIIENESADTGYGNSSAKIALAALGDWKSGAGDLGGDHVR